jgi:hypothetical protein
MPHSAEPMIHLAAADSGDAVALYWVSDEPLLKVRSHRGWWLVVWWVWWDLYRK